ncbi:hypothetical protein M0R45_005272 [Rubus argutus]|uniref:Uncharacterized protein n=1 Tax=Rubus argutus TaxID=59490 RepID=A0AAW1YMB7_RUBAR
MTHQQLQTPSAMTTRDPNIEDGKAGLIKEMKQSSRSVGTTVSVSGAFVAALCNGSAIFSPSNDTEIATECKGPLFVAVSRALGHWEFAIAAVMVVISLRDALHLGRLRTKANVDDEPL